MPKKKLNIIPKAVQAPDNVRETLEQIITNFKNKLEDKNAKELRDGEIKALTAAVDSLLKVSRNEQDISERLKKVSDKELIKLSKQAARRLKKSNKIIESDD